MSNLDSAIDRFDNRMANLAGESRFINGAGSYKPEPFDIQDAIEEFALDPKKTSDCITDWADFEIHCATTRAMFLAYLDAKYGSPATKAEQEKNILTFAKSLCLNLERGFEQMARRAK